MTIDDTSASVVRTAQGNPPRAYNLDDPNEVRRLLREVNGYLRTCIGEHHGTDRAGRAYVADAMRALMEREPQFSFTK